MLLSLGMLFCLANSASAQKVDCLECHSDLTKGKVVHAAVQMGCESCHTGVDASAIPHKLTGNKGLKTNLPDLCYECHSKAEFTKKDQHAPVAGGMCLSCHVPHSGPNNSLLQKEAVQLCRQCHEDIEQKHRVMIGSPPHSHPLFALKDPKRKGRRFDCLSCHVPHSSAWGKLFRYEAQNAEGLCKHCHEFLQ
jgi:predicted CXXCH cytochrome family protein